MRENVLSVGIDIGTSTTQLVFSRLTIENTASIMSIPKIQIIDKEVVYRSDIHFTPLLSETKINGEAIRKIIELEYIKADIPFEKIDTGAVIITGETARKENANEILSTLSGLAGDFVVAAAGPDLESIIAGKGAGAGKLSKEKSCTVVNLDIGGGTTNIAIFKNGEVVDTACLDIGGRLIKFEDDQLKVAYASKKIKLLAKDIGVKIQIGKSLSLDEVELMCKRMADILAESLGIIPQTPLLQEMLTGTPLKLKQKIDYISFSGGVADCINSKDSTPPFKYCDIGIILGKSIGSSSWLEGSRVIQASETIGATVVGAGTHTTEISGSTITIESSILPMKNIPILRLNQEEEELVNDQLSCKIAEKLDWFRLENGQQLVALAMKGFKNPNFHQIQQLAKAIIKGFESKLEEKEPLIIVVENDMAKVLGQGILAHLIDKKDVICIDSIKVDNGDYIDIGKPLANGKVVPVIIKTLVLNY
ncbi:Reactivating factor of Adenosylcobalamin-dependent ethanolamine ammonia lyase [Alkaliphilus peptidifermentans DSM 18978]|uniref:Reactivating factor of Adenosylcobalamin-dependent ethanolamine ammonia lyase n=1 Tax=Alkaliphilus peptidifermentans DSM 18978 TaxID=1120976 RepID=A0A1G5KUP6_9FIRM|nr:ethanolamine ammonia-lyase reactivating factor EutA [Alkaliphilus peptidifermentans]SCZ04327.1 Reactivating factor of Adenosylcobalamin-dependent ethanolamine ammonia lyase [Alkaliphilus peptidifermentans DSM 18978]